MPDQLKPGMLVSDGPIAFMAKIVGEGDAQRVVLHFEHRCGASTFPLKLADAQNFAEQVLALVKPGPKLQIATADQMPR